MIQSLTTSFSLVKGGPVHRLQSRLGLLSADGLPGVRCAAAAAAVAWLPLALLTLFDRWMLGGGVDAGFFFDVGDYARFLIACFALVITDRLADKRINRLLDGFTDSGIIGHPHQQLFVRALNDADRRTSSGLAEALIIGIAIAMSIITIKTSMGLDGGHWIRSEDGSLSLAGKWSIAVSTPLYFFLLIRWLWRFAVWAVLLNAISRLPLRLVPTHPDRCGGLGFLTLFPLIFTPLAFILSIDIASSCLREVLDETMDFELLRAIWLLWTAVIVLLFVGPLITFSRTLLALRESSMVEYSTLVSRIKRDGEQQLGQGEPADPVTISAMADIDPGMDTIQRIKTVPISILFIVPLVLSSLLPFLAVATALVPLGELFSRLVALIGR